MKALILTNEFPPYIYGGAGVHVEYLTREMSRLIDVEVRCFGDQYGHFGNLSFKGYNCDKKAFEGCDKQLRSPLAAFYNNVLFNIAPIDANVVHCHTWYTHMGGIMASKAYGLPLIITTHSLEPLRPWKREQLGRGYDLSLWVEKTAMEMADAIIAVSHGMKQDVVNLFDIDESKIAVIYNGVDTDEYTPQTSQDALLEYGINPDKPYVLFVGRITRQKGIIHLVNAIKHINDEAQIVLCAGQPDTEEIKNEMEEGVRRLQAKRNNILWIQKMVPKKPLIELYSHAAVFCCPSIYEPFGIINLEAMACGTPVVASAVGGIVEIIEDGKTGFLVPLQQYKESPFEPVDPEQFSRDIAQKINKCLDDKELRTEMGKNGRARAEQYFSWKAIARDVVALYERCVQSRGAAC
ncbi:glycogen synthase [Candidatus Magnetobacterium casense]|uniref:Glycogen synthase n=1 Tax=Candidatus Magnetobacterium casense TaxID=1455061 RepID=A0ABS6S2P9_9BACT|nr:glycogen synthase [Candidatus Magnetobacterium casensis]MBV6342693.1 glycogen synthase [Candidatus Magnetobacterium casensis]